MALQFAHVRMVAEVPWSGVALAELGGAGGDPDVTVDTQLVSEPDAPEAFIALGSQDDVHLAEYALVQVPSVRPSDVEPAVVLGGEQVDLAAAQLRASILAAQIEELRTQRTREGAAHADARSAIETELAERLSELQEAEVRAADASAHAERAASELRGRDDNLARMRDRLALAIKEVDDERRLRSRLELEFAAVQRGIEEAMLEAQERSAEAGRVPELEAAIVKSRAARGTWPGAWPPPKRRGRRSRSRSRGQRRSSKLRPRPPSVTTTRWSGPRWRPLASWSSKPRSTRSRQRLTR